MDLSVITVTWNSKNCIGEQIRSVQAGCRVISYEHCIVDNASSDGTGEYIKKEFPEVTLIQNRKNNGFGAANNQAAKEARGGYLLFLNPDMRVTPGSLDIMLGWMRAHPPVGLASCLLVNEEGEANPGAQPRRFPTWRDQLIILLKLHHLFPKLIDTYLFKDFDPAKEQMVDSVRGSFMLMRRAVYEKLGFAFDPRYFIWFEDVDLCREVWRLGWAVMHTPVIKCVDHVGQSFKQRPSVWKQKQFSRSLVAYFRKWEPWYATLIITLARPVGIALAWVYSLSR
ncbi:MAG: glycosyltransferase family 2 protein [Candidatus Magasanikbacteria bacterium]|nr:glycosyltransferase family 2 protein [Candidatus Magasanikbacteria bacterium]